MSDDTGQALSVFGAAIVAALGALWAAIRRRRRRKGGSFRPRARFRGYISMRTHDSAPNPSLEPPPFEDERDTGRHHKPRERDSDD